MTTPADGSGAISDGGGRHESSTLADVLERDLHALLQAIQGSAVEEIRLERGGTTITLKRSWDEAPAFLAGDAGVAEQDRAAALERVETEILASVVGVFHRSREPEGAILAQQDELVDAGRCIGVIEALGLATDVEAPKAGLLSSILRDGQPVGYGDVIAVLSPPA